MTHPPTRCGSGGAFGRCGPGASCSQPWARCGSQHRPAGGRLPIVAFVDSGLHGDRWLARHLVAHFDDPRWPRWLRGSSPSPSSGLLARFQTTRPPLDMGPRPELVTFGRRWGFCRRRRYWCEGRRVGDSAFDEDPCLGEDVDLIWRLSEGRDGWSVTNPPRWSPTRYDPPSGWARRSSTTHVRCTAGPSAPRAPGTGTVLRLEPRDRGNPVGPQAIRGRSGVDSARHRRHGDRPAGPETARSGSTRGWPRSSSAGRCIRCRRPGNPLRRGGLLLGWIALGSGVRVRPVRAATAAMPDSAGSAMEVPAAGCGSPRYLGLRLIEDAAYGGGGHRRRCPRPAGGCASPLVRLPYLPGRNRR